MAANEKMRRYIIFLIGLFINSFGVSFITKANLGTSPISSIPYTLSLGYPLSLGQFTFIFNILLVLLQIAILRKDFKKESFLQIPVTILFSMFIDMTMNLLSFMNPSSYILKFIYLILGCAVLGLGVFIEVIADVVMLPGESFVNTVSKAFNTDFGKTKIVFDSSMTIISGVMGIILYHKLAGVREGTIIAAVLVGMIARFLKRKLEFIEDRWIVDKRSREKAESAVQSGKGNIVITIGREYGSGGRIIGRKLAEKLNLKFYDREIMQMTAEEMHIDEKEVEEKDQKLTNSLIYDMVAQFYGEKEQAAEQDKLFNTEKHLIEKIAGEGNCVIVGRCADYICRNMDNVYDIFLYADNEHKIREIMKRENISYKDAEKHVKEINKMRFNHYKYYTGGIWGISNNYDLCIDTGKTGHDKAIALIKEMVGI
ncbi:cytidylate kinase family protein [Clostridium botulinum]|nr:cytidylate kinase family protein [Clostridium botulinum]